MGARKLESLEAPTHPPVSPSLRPARVVYVLANDGANAGAKRIKARALIELGERQVNAIARNYYLSSARSLLRDLPPQ